MDKDKNLDKEYKIYEAGFHISPKMDENKAGEVFVGIREFIEKEGGSIISFEMPKLKILSYEMSKDFGGKKAKFKEGFFSWIKFEGEGTLANSLKVFLDKNENIFRFLIIKTVKENTIASLRAPLWKKGGEDRISDKKVESKGEVVEKVEVSEAELDKAIDSVIAE